MLSVRSFRERPVSAALTLLLLTSLIPTIMITPVSAQSTDKWVTSDGTDAELTRVQNEPSVAIHPTDNAIVVAGAKDYRNGDNDCGHPANPMPWLGFYNSTDSGQTWTNRLLPGGPAQRDHPVLGEFDAAHDPVLVFDADGILYYLGGVRNGRMWDEAKVGGGCGLPDPVFDLSIFVATSRSPYTQFNITIVQRGVGTTLVTDKPWMSVDKTHSIYRGRVYVCWAEGDSIGSSPTRIRFSYSVDHAVTWSSPITITSDTVTQGCQIGVSPDGKVFIAWMNQGADGTRIKIAKSQDGGSTWTMPGTVTTVTPASICNTRGRLRTGPIPLPSMAVDELLNRTTYIAWDDGRNASTDCTDILFVKSTDEGATWTNPPLKVNFDTLPQGDTDGKRNDQVFPTISVSDGIVSIAFYDFRNSPDGTRVDVYLAYSFSRGDIFMPNLRISDVNSDPTKDSGLVEDYITLVSLQIVGTRDSLVQVVWTDTRDPPGTVPENQDTWTERLILDGGGGSVARGSLITLGDGSKNTVQNLHVDDHVLLVDVYTGLTYSATLTEIRPVYVDNLMTMHTEYGLPLRVDANPRLRLYILAESGPVLTSIMELHPGDLLYNYDVSTWVRITDMSVAYGGSHEFYDLLTDPFLSPDGHYLSFIANGYADPCESPCKLSPIPP